MFGCYDLFVDKNYAQDKDTAMIAAHKTLITTTFCAEKCAVSYNRGGENDWSQAEDLCSMFAVNWLFIAEPIGFRGRDRPLLRFNFDLLKKPIALVAWIRKLTGSQLSTKFYDKSNDTKMKIKITSTDNK